jgi:hypothetical protein
VPPDLLDFFRAKESASTGFLGGVAVVSGPMRGSARQRQLESIAVVVVLAAIIAMAIWFFFFAHGGLLEGW